jgi:hypothetical protein
MYWLKPFDAINDAANASALLNFNWPASGVLEVGGGDGVFSFIMHGGEYSFLNDRYEQADPGLKGDIYDTYSPQQPIKFKRAPGLSYDAGIDLKLSHLLKSRGTGLYRNNAVISSLSEALAVKDNIFSSVFLYTFHGLKDYSAALKEARRVIKKDGHLFMVALNSRVHNYFLCYRLGTYFRKIGCTALANYFFQLDSGRRQEIGMIFSKGLREWNGLLSEAGFSIEEVYNHVSPLLWVIYDTQTRPFLRILIHITNFLKKVYLKPVLKIIWFVLWFPVLVIFYLLFAAPRRIKPQVSPKGIFFVFKAKAV